MIDENGNLAGGYSWNLLRVGGLGYVTGLTIAADGSAMGCRTDVGGGYRWDTALSEWVQLIANATMPAGVVAAATPSGGHGSGVWELGIAPSDPDVWWMGFKDRMFRSDDGGRNFDDTSLNGSTGLYMNSNGGTQRLAQGKLAIDPANPEVVYIGTANDGLWRYMSGAWANVASVPDAAAVSSNDRRILIAVDPSSSLVGSGATSRHSIVYASIHGVGLMRSTDGGDSFADVTLPGGVATGSSYAAWFSFISPTGVLWIGFSTGAHSNVWRYDGSWSQLTTFTGGEIKYLAMDPKDNNRLVGFGGDGKPLISLNGGTSFAGFWQPSKMAAVATDVPIIASVLNDGFAASGSASVAAIFPHPTEDLDYIPMGLGVCAFADPWPATNGSTITWIEKSAGIEELVTHSATFTPKGAAILCSHDKAIIRSDDHRVYPEASYPPSDLTNGYNTDWAIDDPDFLVGLVQKGSNFSGFSENDGRSWQPFPTSYSAFVGGSIAVSNRSQIVVFPGQNAHPRYSHDEGETWADCVFAGVTFPASGSGTGNGWGFGATDTRRFIVCADKEVPGTFYAFNYGATGQVSATQGIWKSTNGGANWTRIASGEVIPAIAAGYHAQIICAGNGVLFMTTGDVGSFYDRSLSLSQVPVKRSLDGGVTWTTVSGVTEAVIALGGPAPGSAYKTLYMLGWNAAGVYGLYSSHDLGDTLNTLEYYDTFDQPYALAADPRPGYFGRVVLGFTGTGWRIRNYRFFAKGA